MLRAVTDDPEWERLMNDYERRKADLEASNVCRETLPHHDTPGVCPRCGTGLTGRQRRWCSVKCQNEWRAEHDWGAARKAAKRRDGHRCVRDDCPTPMLALEVNHIEPRVGRGYGWGCHNHQANLETLCRPHHVEVTKRQRQTRVEAARLDDGQGVLIEQMEGR